MLDGRIDTQGTVANLRSQGILEIVGYDAISESKKQENIETEVVEAEKDVLNEPNTVQKTKKVRKLILDEHRETGGVKWSIYKSYLKASYVSCRRGISTSSHQSVDHIGFGAYWHALSLSISSWVSRRSSGSG